MNLKFVAPAAIAGIVIIATVVLFQDETIPDTVPANVVETKDNIETDVSGLSTSQSSELEIMITDGQKHLIPLDKIRGGGPPKDGIPSIDDPKFATLGDSQFVSDSDVVIGLDINGEAKAYPLFILVWHEIVNDTVGGVPVSVTYCPLCYTNQVFERIIDDQVVEFGTSGKLYNSNLLMYDRLTDSYWSQSLGTAVTGELTGMQLKTIPFDVITWDDWKQMHPETLVLTTDTGHIRSYAADPYGNYYTEPRIMFPVENYDERMHPKEIIIGFNQGDVYKAFKQSDIESFGVINDGIADTPLMLVSLYEQNSRAFDRTVNGNILEFEYKDGKIFDTTTDSEWNYDGLAISGELQGTQLERMSIHPGFWFEWVAFHPDTLVYGDA